MDRLEAKPEYVDVHEKKDPIALWKLVIGLWKAPHCFPSEPIMVPSGEGGEDAEDDGVVLSQCYDAAREESFLLVLDAKDMTELARAYLGMVCPSSFHGRWMA